MGRDGALWRVEYNTACLQSMKCSHCLFTGTLLVIGFWKYLTWSMLIIWTKKFPPGKCFQYIYVVTQKLNTNKYSHVVKTDTHIYTQWHKYKQWWTDRETYIHKCTDTLIKINSYICKARTSCFFKNENEHTVPQEERYVLNTQCTQHTDPDHRHTYSPTGQRRVDTDIPKPAHTDKLWNPDVYKRICTYKQMPPWTGTLTGTC